MSNFDEKPEFIHENRRLEEAHDKAQEKLEAYWRRKYGLPTTNDFSRPMYLSCSNNGHDDLILCDEAQDIFNQYYQTEIDIEMHL